jgi:Rps23 Pro-64 3,4-dihydroxylase Tpa1-like proline 4-hydroxylase
MIDFERLERLEPELREEFLHAKPFPHVVIDDFLPQGTAEAVLEDFARTEAGWNHYRHYNEQKLAVTDLSLVRERIRALLDDLHSQRFRDLLSRVTGIDDLIGDPDLEGGCMHQTLPGGALNMHTDFLSHSRRRSWSRQLNLLLYLNKGWKREWMGDLELWDREFSTCVRKLPPEFNRCVVFRTSAESLHGHPHALACPPGESRKSIALYYFRDEGVEQRVAPTRYHPLPGDPARKRFLMAADSALVRVYAFLKRKTPLSDRMVSRVLKHF